MIERRWAKNFQIKQDQLKEVIELLAGLVTGIKRAALKQERVMWYRAVAQAVQVRVPITATMKKLSDMEGVV